MTIIATKQPHFDLYSKTQQAVLGYTPLVTALFSLIGSVLIFYSIFRRRHQQALPRNDDFDDDQQHKNGWWKNINVNTSSSNVGVYERLMIGGSILTFLSSAGVIVFGPWAVPRGVTFVVGARGNITTCNFAGFFTHLFFGSMWYSFILPVAFVLLEHFEWNATTVARYIELPVHFLAYGFSVGVGIRGITNEMFNPSYVLPGFCWFTVFPPRCGIHDDVPCSRGEINSMAGGYIFLSCWVGIFICIGALIWKEFKTEARLHQFTFTTADNAVSKARSTTIQALKYIGAFTVVYFPVVVLVFAPEFPSYSPSNRAFYFTFAFLVKLLTPLQGFFNAIIFLYPSQGSNMMDREWVQSLNQTEAVLHALGGQITIPCPSPAMMTTTTTTTNASLTGVVTPVIVHDVAGTERNVHPS